MIKRLKQLPLFFLFLSLGCLGGCATYYPLRNEKILNAPVKKEVFVMPFDVGINAFLGVFNTREKLEEKTKSAREMLMDVLQEELPSFGYKVVGQINLDEYDKKDFDEERKRLIDELFYEYRHGKNSIGRNLKEEKGKLSEYSLGIRTKEFVKQAKSSADTILFVGAVGYVANLTALESNAMNTAAAIFTLGLSKLAPVSDDIIFLELTFVDVETGEIYWVNNYNVYGQSYLLKDHIRAAVKGTLKPLNAKSEKK